MDMDCGLTEGELESMMFSSAEMSADSSVSGRWASSRIGSEVFYEGSILGSLLVEGGVESSGSETVSTGASGSSSS